MELTPKELRERNKYSSGLYRDICDRLQKDADMVFTEAVNNLIRENCALLPWGTSESFIYAGQMYHIGHYDRRAKVINGWKYAKINKELHISLVSTMAKLKAEYAESLRYFTVAKNYIAQIMIAAKHIDDVRILVPSRYLQDLPSIAGDLFNYGAPMTPEERAAFKKYNYEGELAFAKLCLLELIKA